MWGVQWAGQHIQFHIDNMSVVDILHKGSTKEPSGIAMHLLRCLSFFAAHYRFSISACHIPGVHNTVADNISRGRVSSLHAQVPGIRPQAVVIPRSLWSLLIVDRPDWTSSKWRNLFVDFIQRA